MTDGFKQGSDILLVINNKSENIYTVWIIIYFKCTFGDLKQKLIISLRMM